jgi:hypothetical protein
VLFSGSSWIPNPRLGQIQRPRRPWELEKQRFLQGFFASDLSDLGDFGVLTWDNCLTMEKIDEIDRKTDSLIIPLKQ